MVLACADLGSISPRRIMLQSGTRSIVEPSAATIESFVDFLLGKSSFLHHPAAARFKQTSCLLGGVQ
jgi:hypothetical protein